MIFRIKCLNVYFYEILIGIYMYEYVCFSRYNVMRIVLILFLFRVLYN